jgi:hypothetical protein
VIDWVCTCQIWEKELIPAKSANKILVIIYKLLKFKAMENELNKLSAVNWLINQLHKKQNGDFSDISYNQMFEQAKQMEKEQIMEAHYAPKYGCFNEQYYEQTYGGNK